MKSHFLFYRKERETFRVWPPLPAVPVPIRKHHYLFPKRAAGPVIPEITDRQSVRLMGYQRPQGPTFTSGHSQAFPYIYTYTEKEKRTTACLLTATKELWTPLANIPGGHVSKVLLLWNSNRPSWALPKGLDGDGKFMYYLPNHPELKQKQGTVNSEETLRK